MTPLEAGGVDRASPSLAIAPESGPTAGAIDIDGGAGLPPTLRQSNGAPGTSAAMTLRIRNNSGSALQVALRYAWLSDRPGPLGGSLAQRLVLTIGDPNADRPLYAGPPSGFSSTSLGTLAPGQRRRWRLSLRFPDGGLPAGPARGDNVFQGSQLSARYVVRATDVRAQSSVGTNR